MDNRKENGMIQRTPHRPTIYGPTGKRGKDTYDGRSVGDDREKRVDGHSRVTYSQGVDRRIAATDDSLYAQMVTLRDYGRSAGREGIGEEANLSDIRETFRTMVDHDTHSTTRQRGRSRNNVFVNTLVDYLKKSYHPISLLTPFRILEYGKGVLTLNVEGVLNVKKNQSGEAIIDTNGNYFLGVGGKAKRNQIEQARGDLTRERAMNFDLLLNISRGKISGLEGAQNVLPSVRTILFQADLEKRITAGEVDLEQFKF